MRIKKKTLGKTNWYKTKNKKKELGVEKDLERRNRVMERTKRR